MKQKKTGWFLAVCTFELSIPQIREGLSEFLDQEGGIKVRIQWELNYLLFQATFNQCDEVVRSHNIQMRYLT